jgi:uncharacterized protein involved in exopolysaccharide biosynthesis
MGIDFLTAGPEKAETIREAGPSGRDASRESSRSPNLDALDYLIVLVRHKLAIVRVTAVALALAILLALLLPKRYTATVTLLPPQQGSSMGTMLASQLGNLGGMGGVAALAGSSLGLKNPNDMYVAMFKSQTVEDAMIRRFDLKHEYHKHYLSDARKEFERYTIVDGSSDDGLIHISVEDRDPRRAAMLANGYVDQFRDLSQHLAITEAAQRRLFFQQQLDQAKDKLVDAEESLKQTEQKTGLIELAGQTRALIESAASLRAQIAAKEVQIQALQTYAAGENAQLVQAQQELDSLRAQLARLAGSEDFSTGRFMVPKGKVPEVDLEYSRKLRDVKYYETIFDILARQFEMAKLDEAREGALIQVVDPAIAPDHKSSPQRLLIIVCGAFLGLLLGVFWAFWQSAMERLRKDPEAEAKLSLLRRTWLPK